MAAPYLDRFIDASGIAVQFIVRSAGNEVKDGATVGHLLQRCVNRQHKTVSICWLKINTTPLRVATSDS